MIVRPARAAEFEAVAALMWRMQPEMPDLFAATWPRWRAYLAGIFARGVVLVAVLEGELAGAMLLSLETVPWGERRYLAEHLFYVAAEYRRSGAPGALVSAARAGGGRLGVPLLMARTSGPQNAALDRWYRMQGGVALGGRFLFR